MRSDMDKHAKTAIATDNKQRESKQNKKVNKNAKNLNQDLVDINEQSKSRKSIAKKNSSNNERL